MQLFLILVLLHNLMLMKYLSRILSFLLISMPLSLYAQNVDNVEDVQGLFIGWLTQLGYLFWMGSIVAFFYGLVKFINNANDSEAHEKGKSLMIWGLISFLVLISLWGIVQVLLVNTLDINATDINFVDKNGAIVP